MVSRGGEDGEGWVLVGGKCGGGLGCRPCSVGVLVSISFSKPGYTQNILKR